MMDRCFDTRSASFHSISVSIFRLFVFFDLLDEE